MRRNEDITFLSIDRIENTESFVYDYYNDSNEYVHVNEVHPLFDCFLSLIDIDVNALVEDLIRIKLDHPDGISDADLISELKPYADLIQNDFAFSQLLLYKIIQVFHVCGKGNHDSVDATVRANFVIFKSIQNYLFNGDFHNLEDFYILDESYFLNLLAFTNGNYDDFKTVKELYRKTGNYRPIAIGKESAFTDMYRYDPDPYRYLEKNRSSYQEYENRLDYGSNKNIELFRDQFDYYLLFMVHELILQKLWVIRCKNCNRSFLSSKRNRSYCDRPLASNPDKTCIDVGANAYYQKTIGENEIRSMCRKLQQRFYNRANPNRIKHITPYKKQMINWFQCKIDEYNDLIESGSVTEDQFLDWLRSVERNDESVAAEYTEWFESINGKIDPDEEEF